MAYISGTSGNDDLYSGRNADHLDGGAGEDTLVGNGGDDTLEGGKGNDSLSGGDGSDTFVYANGDGNDIIVDYEEDDLIKITSGTISRISTSSNGDVIFKIGSGKITVQNAGDKIITYEDSDNVKHFYPINLNSAGTSATLLAAYGKDEFNAVDFDDSETLRNINASPVTHDLSITGNKQKNVITGTEEDDYIDGKAGADKLYGGSGDDTIIGGAGNDSLSGDTVKDTETSGKNIILKLASGKNISVIGGKGYSITYIDDDGEHVYPENPIVVNDKETTVTLLADYSADTFDVTAQKDFGTTARTIDASAVTHSIDFYGSTLSNQIIGSAQDNYIDGGAGKDTLYGGDGNDTLLGSAGNDLLYGGSGNDSLWGGAGTDTLFGDDGADTFVFTSSDGNNVISDYDSSVDTIIVLSGSVALKNVTGGDIIFSVGTGQITVKDSTTQYVEVVDSSGNRLAWRNGDRS